MERQNHLRLKKTLELVKKRANDRNFRPNSILLQISKEISHLISVAADIIYCVSLALVCR